MDIEFFAEKHLDMVNEWWEKTSNVKQPFNALPKVGMIAFDRNGEGLAAGWLVRTDTTYCFLDNFIANPDGDRKQRSRAIDEIIEKLSLTADYYDYQYVMAFPQVKRTLKRLKDNNWETIYESSPLMRKEI